MVAGSFHTCALSAAGGVACWGAGVGSDYPHFGQSTVPAASAAGNQVAVAAGTLHTCALSTAGGVSCWGLNDWGQTAVPASAVAGGQVAVAIGLLHTCALSVAGEVSCWGYNGYGQTSVPAAIAASGQVAVAAGRSHTCALSSVGAVVCWGRDEYGQSTVPAAAVGGGQVAVVSGAYHNCVLSASNAVSCWGSNGDGQTAVPAAVAAGGQVAVAAGQAHTCALSAGGAVTCWGGNSEGQTAVTLLAAAAGGVALPCLPTAFAPPSPSRTAAPTLGSLSATGTLSPRVAVSFTATQTPSAPATAVPTSTPTATYVPGVIMTFAGTGAAAYGGDGTTAVNARLHVPTALALDGSGNLLVADMGNHRIRRVAADTGIITTLAGAGEGGFSGDGGPAIRAKLYHPYGLAVDNRGNVLIADTANHRVRQVSVGTGVITTLAGNGVSSFSGDGGPATSAGLQSPLGLTVDASGNVFIADTNNHRVRHVAAGTGVITTLAGVGAAGFSGDGGPATSAALNRPLGLAVDFSGDLLIADLNNHRIRRVATGTGVITTIAGNGVVGFSGDGGPATSAALSYPHTPALDVNGSVLFTDFGNHRVRRVAVGTGVVTTLAGTGVDSFSGDGGPAISASLHCPHGLVLDNRGNVLFADRSNNRIRIVSAPSQLSPRPTPSPSATPYCQQSLFRPLPRTDLVGSLVGTALTPTQPVALPSESACRQACCDAASCDGFTFDASSGAFNPLAHCFLFVNVTQLVPNNGYVSGIRESVLL